MTPTATPVDRDLVGASLIAARQDTVRFATRLTNGDRNAAENLVEDVLSDLWVRAATAS